MIPKINTSDLTKKARQLSDVRIVGLLAFGIVVLLVTWSTLNVLQTNYDLQKKEAELRQKNQVRKLENENLKLKNVYLETNEYLELTARRQFNKAAPGEKLYIVPKEVAMSRTVELPKTQEQIAKEQTLQKSKYHQNLNDWLDFLLNRNPADDV